MNNNVKVSVVIPHHNGKEIIFDCINSLIKSTKAPLEIIVVDNASSDGSIEFIKDKFPFVKIVRLNENRGFAGGCNAGIMEACADYILILNNDTIHESGFIEKMLTVIEKNREVAAVQPKILSFYEKEKFDYSGACGGEIDIFGFPFARGRLFESIEYDYGQYDDLHDSIFWASGTCMLARKEVIEKAGYFNETFFAHMEEIDLQWRMHLMGYEIRIVPEAVIYHRSGYTLDKETYLKKYLNHRNSLLTIILNYGFFTIIYLYPIRLFLDFLSLVFSIFSLDIKRFIAIINAHFWIITHPLSITKGRKRVRLIRQVKDRVVMKRMLKFPVSIMYYLLGKKKYSQLL